MKKYYKTNTIFENIFIFVSSFGEMAEWSNAVVLKTIVPQGTGGSNPSLSALVEPLQSNDCRGLFFCRPDVGHFCYLSCPIYQISDNICNS